MEADLLFKNAKIFTSDKGQPITTALAVKDGAIQLGIEASKGSIEVGKDADFLVFDNDLLAAEPEGFSHHKPSKVYFCGKKAN